MARLTLLVQKKDFRTICQDCNVRGMKKPYKNSDKKRDKKSDKRFSRPAQTSERKSGEPHKSGGKPQNRRDERSERPQPSAPRARLSRPDLYGFHAVREAWLNPEREISTLYATAQGQESFAAVLAEARAAGLTRPAITLVEKPALESALPEGAVHQGLALVCRALPEVDVTEIMIRASGKKRTLVLILDQVTDPHNVGAILRSACAFGAAGVIMQRKHAPELAGPAGALMAKAACGAIEHVPLAYETNLSRTIEALQEGGYFVYGLDERGEKTVDQIPANDKIALVLGAEGPGLRHLIKEHCDMLVRLPMDGPMPSLNVSNAAAVALYAVRSLV